MSDFAKMFDLIEYRRQDGHATYGLRITATEHSEVRSQWNAVQFYHSRFTMRSALTRRSTDSWFVVCNRIVDRHWQRGGVVREH